jgi:hypothetical protein
MYPLLLFRRFKAIRVVEKKCYERAVVPLSLASLAVIAYTIKSIGKSPQWTIIAALALFALIVVRLLALKTFDIRANTSFEATAAPARFTVEHSLYSLACVLQCVSGLLLASEVSIKLIALLAIFGSIGLVLLPFLNLIAFYSGRGNHFRG